MSETETTTTASLLSDVVSGFLRARLGKSTGLPAGWHPPQPHHGWEDSDTPRDQSQARLFQLPREVRDIIYQSTLGACTMLHVTSESVWLPPCDLSHDFLDEEVYTNDIYFDKCLETITEQQIYKQSRVEDPKDRYGMVSSACRYGCCYCERHQHCAKLKDGPAFETALLRVCRQVHREATIAIWKTLVFSFRLQHTLTTFIDQITPLQKHSLRTLHFSVNMIGGGDAWTWDPYDLMNALASLPHLQKLHLSLRYLCRGDFPKQMEKLRKGSLLLWKEDLIYFQRPSLREVTVTIEDSHRCRPYIKTANSRRLFPEMLQTEPWTTGKRAEFADALRRKLLS